MIPLPPTIAHYAKVFHYDLSNSYSRDLSLILVPKLLHSAEFAQGHTENSKGRWVILNILRKHNNAKYAVKLR